MFKIYTCSCSFLCCFSSCFGAGAGRNRSEWCTLFFFFLICFIFYLFLPPPFIPPYPLPPPPTCLPPTIITLLFKSMSSLSLFFPPFFARLVRVLLKPLSAPALSGVWGIKADLYSPGVGVDLARHVLVM